MATLLFAVGLARHDRNRSHSFDVIEDDLAVVTFIGQHPDGFSFSEQCDGLGTVVDLPCSDEEIDRQA